MKLLLAGTEEVLRPVQQSFLERTDVEVLTCTGGRQALESAWKERPDLIVIGDVTDPGPTECWQALQDSESTASVPVLLLLGEAERRAAPHGAVLAGLDEPERILEEAARLLTVTQREHPRRPLKVRVDFYGSEVEGVGHTRDLSESGLFLRSDEALLPGDRVQLIFGLPLAGRPTIRAVGEVVRRQSSEDGGHRTGGLGIRFRKVGERDRRAIATLVHGPQRGTP